MKLDSHFKIALISGLFGAGAMSLLGFQNNNPWVRLQTSFPGSTQAGHINVSGNLKSNGLVLTDSTAGDGFIQFPGEAAITSRAELVGPQGVQGDKGDKGDKGDPGEQGLPGAPGPGRLVAASHVFGASAFEEDGILMQTSITIDEPSVIFVTANSAYTSVGPDSQYGYFKLSYSNGVDELPIMTTTMFHNGHSPVDPSRGYGHHPMINYMNLYPAGTYTFIVRTLGDPSVFVGGQVPHLQVAAFSEP